MNNVEFKKECHDYIDNCLEEYKKCKNIMLDILVVFQTVCEKNDIVYYAAFGTLLGMIRDNNIIPWDADIDVMIPCTEIERVIIALKNDLPSGYYFVSNFIDKTYPFCQIRICKDGYDSYDYHLDVFYMIGYPENEKKQRKFDKRMMKLFYGRFARYEIIKKGNGTGNSVIYNLKKIRQMFLRIIPASIFERKCRKLIYKYNYDDSSYFSIFCHANYKLPKTILEPRILIKTNDYECYIPKDSHTLLAILYNNNLSYIDISKRFNEFYFSYLRIASDKENK